MPPKKQTEQSLFVPLKDIREPVFDVRLRKDPSALRSLADDITENGLQSPIVLRLGEKPYEIVYGHRRYMACLLLKWQTIQAFIRPYTDEQVILIRAGENLQREDLSIIEEGRIYKHLRDTFNLSINAISRKVSRSAPHIAACIDALDLPDFVQEALLTKAVPFTAIKLLMKIEEENWRIYYMRAGVDNGVTAKVAQRWLEDWRRGAEKRQMDGEHDQIIVPIEDRVILTECQMCAENIPLEKVRAIHVCSACFNFLIHDIPHPKQAREQQQES